MKIHHSFDTLSSVKNPVVTTGTFDGVHIGHQTIIRRLNKLAEDVEGESVLITFHPHPRRVLYPGGKGKDLLLICSQEEKKVLMEETGLDHLVIIEFTLEFAKITSLEFVEEYLVGKLNARIVVIGFNHHFGKNREGDFNYLYSLGRKHGFEVEEIPEQDIHNESVSSTKIRKALSCGNIQRANAYLDHIYLIIGETRPDQEKSRIFDRLVFRVLISEDIKRIPQAGAYAVYIVGQDFSQKAVLYVINSGSSEHFFSHQSEVYFSFLDIMQEEPGKVRIYFHKQLHSEKNNANSLVLQRRMKKDLKETDELIY